MWRHIDIANYRSIEAASLDLAPFTLLVGPNGSGKSNFVDALVFARDVALAAAAIERRRGLLALRRWQPTRPTKLGEVSIEVRAAKTSRPDRAPRDRQRHALRLATRSACCF